jgi:AP-3 complex subunit sigma
VECLDRTFENVCELDLVFHFDEVRFLARIVSASKPTPTLGTSYSRRNYTGRIGT